MNTTSNKTLLLILGIVSLVLSRVTFMFINDPEGPNLLVVLGLAAIIFVVLVGLKKLFKL
jgi:hypothetical protein